MTSSPCVMSRVVDEHLAEGWWLWQRRRRLVDGVTDLMGLARHDERIAAHVDGLIVAGVEPADVMGRDDIPTFARTGLATLLALEADRTNVACRLIDWARGGEEELEGVLSAIQWSPPSRALEVAQSLLRVRDSLAQRLGLAAMRLHGVMPTGIDRFVADENPCLRDEALRSIGSFRVRSSIGGEGFWEAWTGVLLDSHPSALSRLAPFAKQEGPNRDRGFRLFLQGASLPMAHRLLRDLARVPEARGWLVRGAGIAGTTRYVPWLIAQMADAVVARSAGEALTLITGIDLESTGLCARRPANAEMSDESQPTPDIDPDEGLPWPDRASVESWWKHHESTFPTDERLFLGAPVTEDRCWEALRTGSQRQRALAANYLCLLEPATALFNTDAPAWRQRKLLAQMH